MKSIVGIILGAYFNDLKGVVRAECHVTTMILTGHDTCQVATYTWTVRVKKLVRRERMRGQTIMPEYYQIRVKGHFSSELAAWFDDLAVTNTPEGEAVLSGYVPDQSALFGTLLKIHHLGITLLSVNRMVSPAEDASGD